MNGLDTVQGVILETAPICRLGVDEHVAALRFGEAPKADGAWAGRRLMWLGEHPAFELTYWCGTCPITFERLSGANGTLSIAELEERLGAGIEDIDAQVLSIFGEVVPVGTYLPMLLRISPRLTYPVSNTDYFAHEQVATWGIDGFWGLPNNPRVPYYRTFETRVTDSAHLYEFVVPMVPPTWNDRDRVHKHQQRLEESARPTAVAISTLDISQPAVDSQSSDYYEHWALTHFLLDGHHKVEAAASADRELQLLALVSVDASLAKQSDIETLPTVRAKPESRRPERA